MSREDAAPSPTERRCYRAFLFALVFSFVCHALAIASMLTLLAPGVDTSATAHARASFVAAHPWLWRLGWIPWQATAVSDLLLGLALLALACAWKERAARTAAILALVCTLLALVPDQWGELLFDTRHVEAARAAASDAAALEPFLRGEARSLELTGTCGGAGYTLMFVGWIASGAHLAGAVRWRRAHLATGVFSAVAFAASVPANAVSVGQASLAAGYPGFGRVVALNAAGFGSLMVWFPLLGLVVAERRRHRGPGQGGVASPSLG